MPNAVQLIAYADRFGGDFSGLMSLLNNEFQDLFSGVHVLPFFDPIDGADAGFDPTDHTKVDSRLGEWSDAAALAKRYKLMADLIVNHVSTESGQFEDVRRLGSQSKYWDLFLRRESFFPDGEASALVDEEIGKIYRPRPGAPFTPINLDTGASVDFWTTFSDRQLDINVECAAGRAYLNSILQVFADAGIREIRLDAAGYAIKRRGTPCFMLPETFEFIRSLSEQAASLGMETLVEIHSYYQTQKAIASQVGRVYDFALPPLVLHTLYSGNADALKRWLDIAPRNCVTVLDTHDGIGIVDAARQGELEGLLADDEIDSLVETIHTKTGGTSRRASGNAASNLDIYQVNSTYYDALGRSDSEYLIARAIQFFSPGTPQVYYVGLLAGTNDMSLVERTGVGRDINRHYYTREEIGANLQREVVRNLTALIRLRRHEPAFAGRFTIPTCGSQQLILRWETDDAFAQLDVQLDQRHATIECVSPTGAKRYTIGDNLFNDVAV
ncbi:MAG: sucrose phosphorylase [Woeseiaceae bacterium]